MWPRRNSIAMSARLWDNTASSLWRSRRSSSEFRLEFPYGLVDFVKNADKIEHALDACAAYALDSERPFQEAADYLMLLRRSTELSDAEISKVQTLALTEIMTRAMDKSAPVIEHPTSKAVKPQNASTLSDARYGTI